MQIAFRTLSPLSTLTRRPHHRYLENVVYGVRDERSCDLHNTSRKDGWKEFGVALQENDFDDIAVYFSGLMDGAGTDERLAFMR
jgi:hypothetical protein